MPLTENYFSLFGLPEAYSLDNDLLSEKYWVLQRQTHPDRYVGASRRDQLLSAQYAAIVNDAHEVLKSPLKRAIYMLKLRGLDLDTQHSANMAPEFLMQQIELREELENIKSDNNTEAALDALNERLNTQLAGFEKSLDKYFSDPSEKSFEGAVQTVNKMQFILKMLDEVEHLRDQLVDD